MAWLGGAVNRVSLRGGQIKRAPWRPNLAGEKRGHPGAYPLVVPTILESEQTLEVFPQPPRLGRPLRPQAQRRSVARPRAVRRCARQAAHPHLRVQEQQRVVACQPAWWPAPVVLALTLASALGGGLSVGGFRGFVEEVSDALEHAELVPIYIYTRSSYLVGT